VPNVIGASTSAARSAIVDQAGFAGVVNDASCEATSNVVNYSPQGFQPLTSVITLYCG
jgi:hypothetical protein